MHLSNINLVKVQKGPYFSCICMFNHLPKNVKALNFNIKKHKKLLKNVFQQHPFYLVDEYLMYNEKFQKTVPD